MKRAIFRGFASKNVIQEIDKKWFLIRQIRFLQERLTENERKYLNFLANAIVDMRGVEKDLLWQLVKEKSEKHFAAEAEPLPKD